MLLLSPRRVGSSRRSDFHAALRSSLTIAVPNKPWFAGVPIYGDALLVQYPIQQRLTNVNGDVVWR